jgi:RNA polymerase sigma-70 factor, ECF subfamily
MATLVDAMRGTLGITAGITAGMAVKSGDANVAIRPRGAGVARSAASEEEERESVRLVERAKNGDVRAFRDLVERYQQRAYAIAYGVLGNADDAEDVAQEAFLKAFKKLSSFRGQSSFYTWFYRIVFNLSVDLSRRRYRHREMSYGDSFSLDAGVAHVDSSNVELGAKVTTPEESLSRLQLRGRIAEAMAQLSPEHRAVISLREVDGLSYAEISDVMGCSKGTVMSRLHHARRKLQRSLREFFSEEKGNGKR